MDLHKIRENYLNYFKEREHTTIPSSSLVPENDPTTLFTGSGMQPLVSFLLGAPHPKGKRLTNSQKCFRSGDIDEVGDNRHTTFFEMLGNWSLGDYYKKEQLAWFFNFLVDELGLPPEKLYVTVFSGDEKLNISNDSESAAIWKELFISKGVSAETAYIGSEHDGYIRGIHDGERVFFYDAQKNWWSRSGAPHSMPTGEPGGPDSEVFYDFGTEHDKRYGEHCHPNCECGRFLEIGNSVFMEYIKRPDGTFGPLPETNVDFGGGLERINMALTDTPDIIKVNHGPILEYLESLTGKKYGNNPQDTRAFRIIADHLKAAVFLITDGVSPSNTDQGYFVRRLIRRSVRYADLLKISELGLAGVVGPIVSMYEKHYPELKTRRVDVEAMIRDEETKFRSTLERGMREFNKLKGDSVSGLDAFILFSTYGFPVEMTIELAREKNMKVDEDGFRQEMQHHQKISRAGSSQKFKGGLADSGETTTMLHTCTHLMLAGLRKYLGDGVHQAGSNITQERTRFDFTYHEKVPRDILDKVEEYVNEAIRKNCVMNKSVVSKDEARKSGVEGSFWEKYPDYVTVYKLEAMDGTVYSRELCGGPHVENTAQIKGEFKITKEEASSAGVRRIKATLVN